MKRHFFYVCTKRVYSRTYGGCTYTLAVWENKGRGKFALLGETQACTRGHKGEDSEAWDVVMQKCPRLIATLKKLVDPDYWHEGYYSYRFTELGVTLTNLGGA